MKAICTLDSITVPELQSHTAFLRTTIAKATNQLATNDIDQKDATENKFQISWFNQAI
jgi:hypothetical protein